ncbi:MAG: 3-hydroxyacyl-ACP dehydratase FabZ family protein [Planctomycetota bacterium]
MSSDPLIDLALIDPSLCLFDRDAIERENPHRHEMSLLERVVYFDLESGSGAAIKPVRENEFWVRGHFPGRPVLPGVLMLEAAAQLGSFVRKRVTRDPSTIGFAAAENVRFRRTIGPGTDVLLMARLRQNKPRVARFETQAFVDGKLVFEALITGMLI